MEADSVITFRDMKNSYSIYRTFEENQTHVYDLFEITKEHAGVLNPYDAGEFAAAFIAEAKKTKGRVILIAPYAQQEESINTYEVYLKKGSMHIEYRV